MSSFIMHEQNIYWLMNYCYIAKFLWVNLSKKLVISHYTFLLLVTLPSAAVLGSAHNYEMLGYSLNA